MEGVRGKAKRGVAMATAGEEPTREFPWPAEARIVSDVLARPGRSGTRSPAATG
jgi:hypothetical protein